MNIKHVLMFAGFILVSFMVDAAVPQWQIVPTESKLGFTATQNGAPVSGEFKTFSGKLFIDPEDLKHSNIEILVDINSISASYAELKATLITADWFNAKLFPNAEFKSSDIQKTGENHYIAKGSLTIRDKTVPVTLTFSAEQPSADKGIVTGSTVIKRSQFGVGQGEWASTNEIKDEVTINFKVSGLKQK